MHLLLRERRLTPAEIADNFGAMRVRFQVNSLTWPRPGIAFHAAQFTGPGCCSITHQRPRPTPR